MYNGKTLGVVIPAYNEELLIADTIKSVPDFVDRVYVVNDASTDGTYEIASNIARQNVRLVVITHEKNSGVGAAIFTGYKRCLEEDMDIAAVMAGDNQMDPAHMIKLITPVIEGTADYTKGDRMSQLGHDAGMSKWRRFGNWLLTWLTRVASGNWHLNDPQNGYTAISHEVLKEMAFDGIYPGYGYCNDILVKLTACGYRIVDIPIPARYGHEKSKIKYSRYIPKVATLLLRDFLWRLKRKYLGRE